MKSNGNASKKIMFRVEKEQNKLDWAHQVATARKTTKRPEMAKRRRAILPLELVMQVKTIASMVNVHQEFFLRFFYSSSQTKTIVERGFHKQNKNDCITVLGYCSRNETIFFIFMCETKKSKVYYYQEWCLGNGMICDISYAFWCPSCS